MLFCCEYILDAAWICRNNSKRMKRIVLKQLNSIQKEIQLKNLLHSLNEDQISSYGLFIDPPLLNSISVSRVQLFATPWTVARHASLFMEFYRQEYWSGLPCPSPGHLPDPGIEPGSSSLQADSLPSEPPADQIRSDQSLSRVRLFATP